MGRLVDICWPELGVTVVAELNDTRNAALCEEFWQHLPFKVLQSHPVVSGESTYAWVPIVSVASVQHRARIVDCEIGAIRYSQGTGNKMSIQYGRGQEPVLQPILGQVLPEYVSFLPSVGKAVWDSLFWSKKLIFVEVRPHDAVLSPRSADSAALPELAQKFLREAERVQLCEPEELRRIRRGEVRDTGSYGQYFTAWDFANGMIRDYIVYCIYPLLKLADTFTPQQIADVLDQTDPPYTDYLAYSGLATLRDFAEQLRAAVRSASSSADVKRLLVAFLRYGNRLNAWSHHYFPWHLGAFYGRVYDGQEFPGRAPDHGLATAVAATSN
ncbi:MAG: DUF3830 domain-containing protein [Janthinobacterium lividum]